MNAQEARIAGENAYYEGKDEGANPFDPSTDEHLTWNDGFNQAAEQDNADYLA